MMQDRNGTGNLGNRIGKSLGGRARASGNAPRSCAASGLSLPGLRVRGAPPFLLSEDTPGPATPAGRNCTTSPARTTFPPYLTIFVVGKIVGTGIIHL